MLGSGSGSESIWQGEKETTMKKAAGRNFGRPKRGERGPQEYLRQDNQTGDSNTEEEFGVRGDGEGG